MSCAVIYRLCSITAVCQTRTNGSRRSGLYVINYQRTTKTTWGEPAKPAEADLAPVWSAVRDRFHLSALRVFIQVSGEVFSQTGSGEWAEQNDS